MRSLRKFTLGILIVLTLAGCAPAQPALTPTSSPTTRAETATAAPTATTTSTPTLTPTSTLTPKPTATRKSTQTRTPTPTATATLPGFQPASTRSSLGTPLAKDAAVIGAENFERLVNTAQWGKGKIIDIGITPDGQTFVVGTYFGLAVYPLDRLNDSPRWIDFSAIWDYEDFELSAEGLVRLRFYEYYQVKRTWYLTYDLATGDLVDNGLFKPLRDDRRMVQSYTTTRVTSHDGTLKFESILEQDPENWDQGSLFNVMYNGEGKILYHYNDHIPDLTFSERINPEGCDLEYFSPCGNATAPVAYTVYDADFSSSDQSLAILYRPWDLGSPESYSLLRTYRASDGQLLQIIGSRDQPVQDFVYIPGRETLLVVLTDGTIQQWEIGRSKPTTTFRHFTTQVEYLAYSYDGKYLLVQRSDEIEVRRSRDGLMVAQYPAKTFALSPVANYAAIGYEDGRIAIEDLDRLVTVRHLEGHTAQVYALTFSPNGQLLASAAEDCGLRLWDVQTGTFLHYLEQTRVDPYEFGDFSSRIFVYYMEFLPGTNRLAGFGSWATMVSWDVNSGVKQFSTRSEPLDFYQGMITVMPHFPESVFIDAANNRFFIDSLGYNLQDGELIGAYQPPANLPGDCAENGPVSPDGKLRFTRGYNGAENRICILDAQDYHVLQTLQVLPEDNWGYRVGWPVLSPDGTQLAVPIWGGGIYVYQIGN